MENKKKLGWNPGRVLFGLSRIGYTPTSAICDIVDNSVTAKASKIEIRIIKEKDYIDNSRRNNVREYVIIDNGIGMSEEKMLKALELGSHDLQYEKDSLSKFGLGLKSAAFSQGDEIQIISSQGCGTPFRKFVLDLTKISEEYFCVEQFLTEEDNRIISESLTDGKGTIIRISRVRNINHPSITKTINELEYKLGVIYYYFMKEDGLKITLQGSQILPYDVLFTDEANENENLDENVWDGKTVRWIRRTLPIIFDSNTGIKANIEVTQLPYPPLFASQEFDRRKEIREKYRIEAGNYGYYVYRNKRLISWAEHFGGIMPLNQEFYSFRGRILIDSTADECFNIDVKKSTITLSDDAYSTLDDLSDEYKRKSKKAWQRAKSLKAQIDGSDPNALANDIAGHIEFPESLPGDPFDNPQKSEEKKKREKEIEDRMREKMVQKTKVRLKEQDGKEINDRQIEEEEIDTTIRGTGAKRSNDKIFRVDNIEDNMLWEPYYDAEKGGCVRINRIHRFGRLIFEDNQENIDMQIMMELMLLQFTQAEIYIQKNLQVYPREQVERVLIEYRRVIAEYLASLCRNPEIKLPPFKDN